VITSVRQYLDRVTNMLLDKRNENATVDINGPRWISQKNNRVAVVFGARLEFESGHVLEISDDFLIEASGDEWSRKFAYFFGAPNGDERERIFLFDNHGFFGAAAHLDLGNDERLYAGDPGLNGFSPENVDIMDVCGFLDLYFDGSSLPWVAP
jgi:hypothetical protein